MASLQGAKIISQSVKTGTCRDGHSIWLVPWGQHHKWVGANGDWHCNNTAQSPTRGHEPVSTSELIR